LPNDTVNVDRLAADALQIPMTKGGRIRKFASHGKEGPAVQANEKQEKFDQIGADNIIKRSGVHIYRKK